MPNNFRCFILLLTCLLSSLLLAACGQNSPTDSVAAVPSEAQLAAYRQRVAALRDKADRIKDVNEIKRLQRSFGYYFDEAQWDDMADLFADNATLEYARDGVYVGKKRIRDYFYALGGGKAGLKEGQLNEHFQIMPVITLSADGTTAKGRWRDLSLQGQYGETALWGEGPYENEYVKDNGVWKISKLHWFQTIVVPYDGGWFKNEDFNKGLYVSDTLPPDSPPTTDDPSWPTTFLPPFHFDNPVGTYRGEGSAAQGEQQ